MLGFTLSEINKLLEFSDNDDFNCLEVWQFAAQRLKEIEAKILDLKKIQAVLEEFKAE